MARDRGKSEKLGGEKIWGEGKKKEERGNKVRGQRCRMRIIKKHPILSIVNNLVIDLPAPANISYA